LKCFAPVEPRPAGNRHLAGATPLTFGGDACAMVAIGTWEDEHAGR
jgi:hypothetical protein